jgi:D-glycero-alpha-D-manno-heptose 1-phosphate guanylyltransferase
VKKVVVATGYLGHHFERAIGPRYADMAMHYVHEDKPLGTGGGLVNALLHLSERRVFVLNGDTLFRADLAALAAVHAEQQADFSLVLRILPDVTRYGSIRCEGPRVTELREKGDQGPGYINGGIYLVERAALLADAPSDEFSLERQLLPKWIASRKVACIPSDGYFMDIGVPADLARANHELPNMNNA